MEFAGISMMLTQQRVTVSVQCTVYHVLIVNNICSKINTKMRLNLRKYNATCLNCNMQVKMDKCKKELSHEIDWSFFRGTNKDRPRPEQVPRQVLRKLRSSTASLIK